MSQNCPKNPKMSQMVLSGPNGHTMSQMVLKRPVMAPNVPKCPKKFKTSHIVQNVPQRSKFLGVAMVQNSFSSCFLPICVLKLFCLKLKNQPNVGSIFFCWFLNLSLFFPRQVPTGRGQDSTISMIMMIMMIMMTSNGNFEQIQTSPKWTWPNQARPGQHQTRTSEKKIKRERA